MYHALRHAIYGYPAWLRVWLPGSPRPFTGTFLPFLPCLRRRPDFGATICESTQCCTIRDRDNLQVKDTLQGMYRLGALPTSATFVVHRSVVGLS